MTIVYALSRLAYQTSLSANLSSNLVVWETGGGKNGNLLTTGDGVHGVDGGDTGGDHFFWVDLTVSAIVWQAGDVAYSRVGVDGTAVDIQVVFGQHLGTLIDGSSGTIEDTSQHVLGDAELQAVTCELDFRLPKSDVSSVPCMTLRTFFTSMPDVPSKT